MKEERVTALKCFSIVLQNCNVLKFYYKIGSLSSEQQQQRVWMEADVFH